MYTDVEGLGLIVAVVIIWFTLINFGIGMMVGWILL